MRKRITLNFFVLLFIVIGFLPVLAMFFKSMTVNGHFSLEAYGNLLQSPRQWMLLGNSLLLSVLVMVLTTVIGVPLGVLLSKTDLPWRRFFVFLFVIPLLVPPYITAVSWFDLLGSAGLLSRLFGASAATITSAWLFGLPGCVLVLFSVFLPIPLLLTMAFLRTVNPRLEEAARLVSGWRGVLKGITMPLILPGILLAALLVFLLTFGEFSVPSFLRYDVFPVESFTQFSAFYDFKAATAATIPLIFITLLALAAEAGFLQQRTYQLKPSAEAERLPLIRLGKSGKWLFGLTALLALFLVAAPIVVLVIQSAGVNAYAEALQRAGDSLWRSVIYAFSGATALVIIGFFVGYGIQKKELKYWWLIDSGAVFLFALPGTVIGIGLISLWNTPWTNFIYATSLIIVLGYVAKYTALTSRITVAQLAQIPPSMEEAAQMAGASWGRRMLFILIPLARRGLAAAWLIGYIFSLRDTAITMLVYPAGHDTLPVRIFTLMANGSAELIAALCMIMILVTLVPAGIGAAISFFNVRKANG